MERRALPQVSSSAGTAVVISTPAQAIELIRMPRKIRALIKDLEKAGWMLDHFTGSHRIFKHPNVSGHVSLSGKKGADAQRYQERLVKEAIDHARRKSQ
jgi:predicted RNA binding protein YcfA (HicA-like mRNA interferase family)